MFPERSTIRWRGRGRGRGAIVRGQWNARPEEILPTPDVSQEQLARISEAEVDKSSLHYDRVTIEGVQYVSSYSWLDQQSPTVLIPGVPAKWLPPGPKTQVKQDDGDYFRDPNAARYPRYPLEPAISSIFQMQPGFDSASVDLFGCGGTFGSLLAFVSGEKRTFRFGIDLVGNSLFLVRKTNTPKQLIDDVYGYGHNFSEIYTAWDPAARGSASHQRIITYALGGLRCLIRSECDGYLPEKVSSNDADTKPRAEGLPDLTNELEDAHTAIEALRVKSENVIVESDLLIQSATASTPTIAQEAIFDLKTRSIRSQGEVGVNDFLHRLYMNQTPNLILAFHQYGMFEKNLIEIHDVREKVKQWEKEHAAHLRRLKAVLVTLRKWASQADHARLEVRRTGTGPLEIWTSPDGWQALPNKWRTRWMGKGDFSNTDA